MQTLLRSLLSLAILVPCCAAAQDLPRQNADRQNLAGTLQFSKRAVRLVGTISDDGRFMVADPDQNVWAVVNPEATKSYASLRVAILAQTSPEKNALRVLTAKPERERRPSWARWSDSAFRR